MKFQRVSTPQAVVDYLADQLTTALLAQKTVTWLVPGGSNIAIVVEVAKHLAGAPLKNLRVTLTDERFVPLGDSDENWQQLVEAGFNLPDAVLYRPIQADVSGSETAAQFGRVLEDFLTSSDFKIGFFGIGSDGHTAGIKPHSFAMDTSQFAEYFASDDFERVTMTPRAISLLDVVVAYANGDNKRPTLEALLHDDLPLADQPAQSLKKARQSLLMSDLDLEARA